jgi:cell division protein FtsI/penicillin-binding protein 2
VARKDGRGYEPGKYMGSFIGGAPADHPRVVAVVSLYMPTGKSYYGGTIAAPAVGKILADVLAYMQVPPELPSSN